MRGAGYGVWGCGDAGIPRGVIAKGPRVDGKKEAVGPHRGGSRLFSAQARSFDLPSPPFLWDHSLQSVVLDP